MVLNPIKQIWKNLINESNARNLVKNSPEKKKKNTWWRPSFLAEVTKSFEFFRSPFKKNMVSQGGSRIQLQMGL